MTVWTRRVALSALALVASSAAGAQMRAEALWQVLARPGHVVLMRHADAPGTGDPPNFRLGDCATQRNLGEAGRAQARRIGDRFRREGVSISLVLTSQWCRARETAALMAVGSAEDAPDALNSFFGKPGEKEAATQALRRRLAALPREAATVVMVTHQVNITALSGVFLRSGEMVVLSRDDAGRVTVLGQLMPE